MKKLYAALMGNIALTSYFAGPPPMVNTDVPLATIKISTPNGDVVINASDYDPVTHTLAKGQEAPKTAAPATVPPLNPDPNAQVTPAAVQPPAPPPPLATPPATPATTDTDVTPVSERYVTKIDGKFFVTNKDGKTLGEDGKVAEGLTGFEKEADAKKSVNFTGPVPAAT